MNFLASFISTFCAASVFIGLLYLLCPDGSMEKSVKYILTLVFILTVISAAAITNKGERVGKIEYSSIKTDTSALDTETARFIIGRALDNAKIEYREITVCTNKTESGSISISKVIIRSERTETEILTALSGLEESIEVVVKND